MEDCWRCDSSLTQCDVCKPGLMLVQREGDTECVTQCPNGYFPLQSTCQRENPDFVVLFLSYNFLSFLPPPPLATPFPSLLLFLSFYIYIYIFHLSILSMYVCIVCVHSLNDIRFFKNSFNNPFLPFLIMTFPFSLFTEL